MKEQMTEQMTELVGILRHSESRRRELEKQSKQKEQTAPMATTPPGSVNGTAKHTADDSNTPLSPVAVPAQKQLKYSAGIVNSPSKGVAALNKQQVKLVPIAQLPIGKKVSISGQSGKLWRWKRSHHQWLLQFKWKWQKPWKLSEMIRHSDETITRARPRPQLLITHKPQKVMWNRLLFFSGFTLTDTVRGPTQLTMQLKAWWDLLRASVLPSHGIDKYMFFIGWLVFGCKFPVPIKWDVNVEVVKLVSEWVSERVATILPGRSEREVSCFSRPSDWRDGVLFYIKICKKDGGSWMPCACFLYVISVCWYRKWQVEWLWFGLLGIILIWHSNLWHCICQLLRCAVRSDIMSYRLHSTKPLLKIIPSIPKWSLSRDSTNDYIRSKKNESTF